MWMTLSLIATLAVVYKISTKNHDHFKKRNIKCPTPVPFMGNLGDVLKKKHLIKDLMMKTYKKFPKERYFGFFDYCTPVIWIKDNELLKQVTVKDYDSFLDHRVTISEKLDSLYTNLLIVLRGKKWKEMRMTMTPAFTTSKMKGMLPLIKECSDQMVVYLNDEIRRVSEPCLTAEVNMKDLFARYTNDVIASVAFGFKVDSFKDPMNELFKMGQRITDTNVIFYLKFMIYFIMPSVAEFFGIAIMDQDSKNFFRKAIRNTMKEREEKGIKRLDMIQLLLEAKRGCLSGAETSGLPEDKNDLKSQETTKRNWSEDELTAQALVFYIAGFETISTLLCFAFYELATRQEVQAKLVEEIDEYITKEGVIQYEIIMTMKYMDKFVSECLRLYPSLSSVDRVCTKPYHLPPPNEDSNTGYQMNVGDALYIPIRSIHRDPRYFPDPEKFDPERFSEENKDSIKPFTYIPFGAGPRQCIGRRFALMEIKSTLFYLLSEFKFVTCSKTKNPLKMPTKMVSMVPKDGVWIGVQKRIKSNKHDT